MKIETLKEWLERIGFEANITDDYLHIWDGSKYIGAVNFDGYLYPGRAFESLNDKDQGQITYLIAKWKGTVKHEAILEFRPDKG